jgi:hypothetical protein
MHPSVEDIDLLIKEDVSDFQTATFEAMLKEILWHASKMSSEFYTDELGKTLFKAGLGAVEKFARKSIMKDLND